MEIQTLEIPPREYLLDPVIPIQGVTMLYAPAGVGKTMLALSMSHAVATGGEVIGWKAPRAEEVVYFDGEMALQDIGARLKVLKPPAENFRIYTPDRMRDVMPDLATHEGRTFVERRIGNARLLVLDNLGCLFRANRENEASDWATTQHWLLELKQDGISTLMLHHSGKGGSQRGTSRRIDNLDTVIALKRGASYKPKDGARFNIHFEKLRGVFGEKAVEPEVRYSVEDGVAKWTILGEADDPLVAEAVRRHKSGDTVRKIAEDMGVSRSKVGRWIKGAEKDEW